eukprot:544624-Prorocentrum_minimum.AAC.1
MDGWMDGWLEEFVYCSHRITASGKDPSQTLTGPSRANRSVSPPHLQEPRGDAPEAPERGGQQVVAVVGAGR